MKRNQISKVSTLQNDHVQREEAKSERLRQQRIRLSRRLTAFVIICIIIFGGLTSMLISKNATLKEKEEQKAEALTKLEEVQDQQEMLNTQIKKLEDDEYIAKLLRKEYFLSDEGEIIFIIPDKEEKGDKN